MTLTYVQEVRRQRQVDDSDWFTFPHSSITFSHLMRSIDPGQSKCEPIIFQILKDQLRITLGRFVTSRTSKTFINVIGATKWLIIFTNIF